MKISRGIGVIAGAALLALAACGNSGGVPGDTSTYSGTGGREAAPESKSSLFDLFNSSDEGREVSVNRYLWNASLDVLDFMPVRSVDPFSGVIVFGPGTPPGGGRAYQATVYITDPALEARSLNVAMQTASGGAVPEGTQRAIEDAILTRARQLRVQAGRF